MLGLCCCTGFSLVVESGRCAPVVKQEPLIAAPSLWHGLEGVRASAVAARARAVVVAPGSTAQAQRLWCPGLDARWHGGSSRTRERASISYKSRRILYPPSHQGSPTPLFLPGEFHGQSSLAGYSPWSRKKLDRAELLSTLRG